MGLTKKLSTDIRQTTESCMMISFNIIFNYYTGLDSDYLIEYFLKQNDNLYSDYGISKEDVVNISLEQQYVNLYKSVAQATCGKIQFSNECIAVSFKKLTDQYSIRTRMVDIKKESETLREILINSEACLSLTLHGSFGVHVTPIGYDTDSEFYTVHNGCIIRLGTNFMNIWKCSLFNNVTDIGDGILFQRIFT